MNSVTTIAGIVLVACMSGPLGAQTPAKQESPATHTGAMAPTTDSKKVLEQLQQVSEESLQQHLTAKDLIGKAVYGNDGQRIGDIVDISLAADLPREFAEALGQTGAQETSATARLAAAGRTLVGERDTIAFLSVGGVMGMGARHVSIPLSALHYNNTEERIELALSKGEVVAVAEGIPGATVAATSGEGATTAAKYAWNDATLKIREAISKDSAGSRVIVTADEKGIVLTGTVRTEAERDRLLMLARSNTTADVKDNLEIEKR